MKQFEINRLKTHCPHGHPYSGENLIVEKTGRRSCRACRNARKRAKTATNRRPRKPRNSTPWQIRFWTYVKAGAPDECWEWQGGRNAFGYGRLSRDGSGTNIKAHRASYEIHYGVDPGELDVCHTCDNPPCCNPAHLFLGTAADNSADMVAKGRWRGNPNPGRLTDGQVVAIREVALLGIPYVDIGGIFSIEPAYVGQLANGYHRADAGGPFTKRNRYDEVIVIQA